MIIDPGEKSGAAVYGLKGKTVKKSPPSSND